MITKPQYQELLKKIATREPHGDDAYWENPVLIGDVLEKMREQGIDEMFSYQLSDFWGKSGFSKSIQQIVEESGWEQLSENEFRLESPDAAELLSYLMGLFLKK